MTTIRRIVALCALRVYHPTHALLCAILALSLPLANGALAENPPLTFGMTAALTGPAAELGKQMRAGVLAAFQEINAAGGIQGRPLQLASLDDGYEPTRTVPNMNQLVDVDNVLAIVGNVGTPTSIAAVPISNRAKTLFYGAFTALGHCGSRRPTDT